jgi:hypothetical protein
VGKAVTDERRQRVVRAHGCVLVAECAAQVVGRQRSRV